MYDNLTRDPDMNDIKVLSDKITDNIKRIKRLENIVLNIKYNSDLHLKILHLERDIVERERRLLKAEKQLEELKNGKTKN